MSAVLDDAQLRRVGELGRETLAQWWERFARERGLTLTPKEIAELIELGKADERTGHQ